jgi:hypothetical protein
MIQRVICAFGAQTDFDRIGAAAQGGKPYTSGPALVDDYWMRELYLFEGRYLLGTSESHSGLSHGFQPKHRREKPLFLNDVVVEIRVGLNREVSINDQLDAWIVNPLPFKKPAQRQFGLRQLQGRRLAEPPANHDGGPSWRISQELEQFRDTFIRRNRHDALLGQRINAAEAIPHPNACPNRPLKGKTQAFPVFALESLGEVGQPFIRGGVIRLARKTGPGDDGTERDEEVQSILVQGTQDNASPLYFWRKRLAKRFFRERGDQLRAVRARSMKDSGNRPEFVLSGLKGFAHSARVGDVRAIICA